MLLEPGAQDAPVTLPTKGSSDGYEPHDACASPKIIEPGRADPLPVEHQQERLVVGQSLLGAGFVISAETPLLPENGAPDGVIGPPVSLVGNGMRVWAIG